MTDPVRVVWRGLFAGLLLPPAIGAVCMAIVLAFNDSAGGAAYLSATFVVFAFGIALVFGGPIGAIAGMAAAAAAIEWRRGGCGEGPMRRRLTITGLVLGGVSGLVFSQLPVFHMFREGGAAWTVLSIAIGIVAGAICGCLLIDVLGEPLRRIEPTSG
jgi:hypothetical protein